MVEPVSSGGVPPIQPGRPLGPVEGKEGGASFKDILLDSIEEANRLQQEADVLVGKYFTGGTENLSDVLSAVEKAELAFKTLMEVRNKLVEAYQEINRMRI